MILRPCRLYGMANGQDFFFVWKSRPIFLSAKVLENKMYFNELNFRKKNEYWLQKY